MSTYSSMVESTYDPSATPIYSEITDDPSAPSLYNEVTDDPSAPSEYNEINPSQMYNGIVAVSSTSISSFAFNTEESSLSSKDRY
jgi:hypothetical protein